MNEEIEDKQLNNVKAKKVNDFLKEAPSQIMSSTLEKNKSFKDRILEKSQKYKPNAVIPSEMVESQYNQTIVQNEQEQNENEQEQNENQSLDYSNSENQDEIKPLTKIVSFISKAPDKISSQNQSSYTSFKQAVLKKSKTYNQQPVSASMKLTTFATVARETINKKNASSFSSFKQNVFSRSKTYSENKPTEKPSELVLGFVQKVPDNITKTSKNSFEDFRKALSDQAASRIQNGQNLNEQQVQPSQSQNPKSLDIQSNQEGIREEQVQKMVLNFFNQVPGKVSHKNSQSFKSLAEKIDEKKRKIKQQSLEMHPQIEALEYEQFEPRKQKLQFEEFRDEQLQSNEIQQEVEDSIHQQGEVELTQIIRQKTPYPDNSLSDAQIINMMQQDNSQKESQRQNNDESIEERKYEQKHRKNSTRQKLEEDLKYERYLNEKEKLRGELMGELDQISQEIREMRKQKQLSDKQKYNQFTLNLKSQRKQFGVEPKNDRNFMIRVSDNQVAFAQADDLIQRMNRQRKEMRMRKEQQYKKVEQYLRRDINAMREQQELIHMKMEFDRKNKIKGRVQAYQQKQFEFLKLQQVNQEFVRELIQRGPQEGKLAEQQQEKVYKIKGVGPQRKILFKNGGSIFLPSIKSIRGKNTMLQQQMEYEDKHNSMPKQGLKARLPNVNQPFSRSEQLQKQLLQEEAENDMIMKYKESRKQLLRAIPQSKYSQDYEDRDENQLVEEDEYQEMNDYQQYDDTQQ